MEKNQIRQFGLLPLPKDTRDYSYHKTFGATFTHNLPSDFMVVENLFIKDQGPTDLCTAAGSAAVSEDQEGVEFCFQWTFAQIKRLLGDWTGYGSDLRTAMKAGVKFGFLPVDKTPADIDLDNRDFVADWNNWPSYLDNYAWKYKKAGFFRIENFYNDIFDSIRLSLYNNRFKKQSIVAGSQWFVEWSQAEGGVIRPGATTKTGLHAFKICGWKQINGQPYLIIQNSDGKDVGDQGKFYFPRKVVNEFFTEGLFCFIDHEIENPPRVDSNVIERIINFIARFLRRII